MLLTLGSMIGASPKLSDLAVQLLSSVRLFGTYVVTKLHTMFYICGLAINFFDHMHVRIFVLSTHEITA